MNDFRKIIEVKANDNFTLECEMENGEIYLYDMSFLKKENGTMIQPLKRKKIFKKVWLEYGALEWPNGFGIHGKTIIRDGELIKKSA